MKLKAIVALVTLFGVITLTGCGYTLQTGHSLELEKEGIHKIYITPIVNDSYQSGVENVVFNSLVRSLSIYQGIRIVSNPEDADAVLTGRIEQADSMVSSTASAANLNPTSVSKPNSFQSFQVASQYTAILACGFSLTRRNNPAGKSALIWSGSFSRSEPFNASNQLGALGTTSPLINESEFQKTIQDISQAMMADVREAMLARF